METKIKNPSIVPEVKNKATNWMEYKSILELTLSDGKSIADVINEKATLENKVAELENFKGEAEKNINALWQCVAILLEGDTEHSNAITDLKTSLLKK